MIPAKEKAKELVYKFLSWCRDWDIENYAILNAKECALITVKELIKETGSKYWYDVKQEIEKL